MDGTPRTLLEAVTYFSDADRALAYAVKLRWPNGIACPRKGCGNADVQFIRTRKLWRCKECKRQFTAKIGMIFEDSPRFRLPSGFPRSGSSRTPRTAHPRTNLVGRLV